MFSVICDGVLEVTIPVTVVPSRRTIAACGEVESVEDEWLDTGCVQATRLNIKNNIGKMRSMGTSV
jgi:hypothetical protein